MELANARGLPGILDVEAPAEPDAFAPASHLAFSLQGLSSFFPGRDPGEALKDCVDTYDGWARVTLGAVINQVELGPQGTPWIPIQGEPGVFLDTAPHIAVIGLIFVGRHPL